MQSSRYSTLRGQDDQANYIALLEARLEALYQTSYQSIVVLDPQHRVLDFNALAAHTSWLRYHRRIQKGDDFTLFVQPDRLDDFYLSFNEALKGKSVFKERLIYAPDQQMVPYEMQYTPVFDAQGEVHSVCFMMVNIEEKQQMRLLLNQEQSFVASILNATHALILAIDAQGKIVRFNRACETLTGFKAHEVVGEQFIEKLVPAEAHEKVRALFRQPVMYLSQVQFELCDKQGQAHQVSWSLDALESMSGEHLLICTGIDITARLAAEKALKESDALLKQAQKMEAVGQLAGSIAHDFNNMLTAISGYAELLKDRVEDLEQAEFVTEILQTSQKAKDLTRQLLMVSRKAPSELRFFNPNHVLLQARNLWQQLLGNQIDLQMELSPEVGTIYLNETYLEQAVMNLILNARDAIGSQGQVKVSAYNHTFATETRDPIFGHFKAGPYVCIEVCDTGCGVPAELRSQIFDPFFTTKEKGKGTGLGLAVVYRIMQSAQGWVQLHENNPQGTCFQLFFPVQAREKPMFSHHLGLLQLNPTQQESLKGALVEWGYTYQNFQLPLPAELEGTALPLMLARLELHSDHLYQQLRQACPQLKVLFLAQPNQLEAFRLSELSPQEDLLLEPYVASQLHTRILNMLATS